MNDVLVRKREAIEAVLKRFETGDPFCVEALLQLPPAQQWIPCSERLPKKEFEQTNTNRSEYHRYPCLVTRLNESRTHTYVCKSYFDGKDFMLYGGYDIDEGPDTKNTIAWMPLPEPYKE